MFETVSFHITKPCNMKCKFCYATFEDFKVSKMLTLEQCKLIVYKLHLAGMQKITFAGGEPMIFKKLDELIIYSKSLGLTTSIITNGSLITEDWLKFLQGYLDWVGISIDSLNPETNTKIGRTSKMNIDYHELISMIKIMGFKLKINTVVNAYNWNESMLDFINYFKPDRWKVFQALRIKEQNDDHWNEIKVTDTQYEVFLNNHNYKHIVPEDNQAMTGSYLLVDPLGRLFENSEGKHTYSESILDVTVNTALQQINLDRKMFIKRGGIYKW